MAKYIYIYTRIYLYVYIYTRISIYMYICIVFWPFDCEFGIVGSIRNCEMVKIYIHIHGIHRCVYIYIHAYVYVCLYIVFHCVLVRFWISWLACDLEKCVWISCKCEMGNVCIYIHDIVYTCWKSWNLLLVSLFFVVL